MRRLRRLGRKRRMACSPPGLLPERVTPHRRRDAGLLRLTLDVDRVAADRPGDGQLGSDDLVLIQAEVDVELVVVLLRAAAHQLAGEPARNLLPNPALELRDPVRKGQLMVAAEE